MSFKKLIKKNTFIVAEIGNNHEGNFKTAIKLIDKASEAKVDAVKFQSYDTQSYLSAEIDKARIKKLDKFSLDFNQFKELSLYAKKKLIFFSTPFNISYIKKLNTIQPLFKISSGDNDFLDLIFEALSYSKPTIISCGLLNLNEIKILYNQIKKKLQTIILHLCIVFQVILQKQNS